MYKMPQVTQSLQFRFMWEREKNLLYIESVKEHMN